MKDNAMSRVLVAGVGLMYGWLGLVAHGPARVLGLLGAVLLLAAALTLTARWRRPVAAPLLAGGALPLAVVTWWSLITPVLAVLCLVPGMVAIWRPPTREGRGTGEMAPGCSAGP